MISICIATYNGEKYFKQQLLSILCQVNTDDEIVISDDGSSDNTLEIIHEINDNRIKLIEGPKTGSPIDNFENALMKAKGDYIFLSDQDDQWMENKIEICMKYLLDYDCVISDCHVVDKNLNIISNSFYMINKTKKGRIYNLMIKNGYLGCCMAFKKQILDKSLPFPKNIPMHDIWIGNVASFYYRLVFIPDKLIKFRRHGCNASPTAAKSSYTIFQKFCFRLNIIKNIILLRLI